ncbi:MAG TPA: T9SS type A sorting domain-containing protein [Bacteroidales bacterium]|nr:T9SS type A sorting domain-containing protein [Bacteroidales bacterium]
MIKKIVYLFLVFVNLSIAFTLQATTFTVTNTNDSGTGSLRYALQMAAATNGPHTINFNIPLSDPNYNETTGVWKLSPATSYTYIIKSDITIDGTSQTLNQGNTNVNGPEIYIDGNNQTANYCFSVINVPNTIIKGFIISGFMYGIQVYGTSALNTVISGNYIGTDELGMTENGNYIGIEITVGANYATIGGLNPEDRNVISGNEHIGIRLLDVQYCNIFGNYVGLNRLGSEAIPNYDGISLEGADKFNNIGGNTVAHRNIVSGNIAYGIPIFGAGAEGNVVAGNYIGTDASGTYSIPNNYGVLFDDGSYNNIVGGETDQERNIISGNAAYGIFIYNMGTNSNIVRGNFIGTDKTGVFAVPNYAGIVIDGAAFKNIIDFNIISGNLQQGIYINITGCDSTSITRNRIGVNVNNEALGNGSDGIRISQGPKYSLIGGSEELANIIAYNEGNGVCLMFDNDDYHLISYNVIYLNSGLGIDLFPPGVNQNDDGDADSGANQGMNFPDISNVIYHWGSGDTEVIGTLNTENPELCKIQIFAAIPHSSGHGQAYEFIAETYPDNLGNWNVYIVGLDPEQFLTCLAIDKDNNTSEFSITRSSTTIAYISGLVEDYYSIFPNPANDFFSLSNNSFKLLQIIDNKGTIIKSFIYDISGNYFIGDLSSGLYILKFVYENSVRLSKLIIN